MPRPKRVTFQRWSNKQGDSEQSWIVSDEAILRGLLQSLADLDAALLMIEGDDNWLAVNVSRGQFYVTGLIDGQTVDLVGDPTACGTTMYIRGGQRVPHPLRHLTNVQQAMEAAMVFYQTETIDCTKTWDRQ